eukprot:467344_1
MSQRNNNVSRRFRNNRYRHKVYRATSTYEENSDHDMILWNNHSPLSLIQSIPSISSYTSNYDDGFLKLLNVINKLIMWLENESDIFDKSLLNQSKFNKVKNEINNVNNCILNGLKNCNDLIENNQISYSNYPKFKARLQNSKKQFDAIDKQIKHSMHKTNRIIKRYSAKKDLLRRAHKPSYDQADEYSRWQISINLVEYSLETIEKVREEMFYQSDLLKKTKTKLLKFINLTGFSGSIIRVISQRSQMDYYMFIIGCFVTLIIIFVLWYYF